MGRLFIFLQNLLPQHALSRLVALLAECPLAIVKRPFIALFIRRYRVDLSEAMIEDPAGFRNFNAFFTRELKSGARPVTGAADSIVSPADGFVSAMGKIYDERVFQAKGIDYTLTSLLGGNTAVADLFRDGSFATVYLSPRDYHRVHMPLAGKLVETSYVPGRLFSVNRTTTNHVAGLFTRNERLVCLFDTAAGPLAIVLVGAMIVAGIETVWSGRACPNRHGLLRTDYTDHAPPIELARGSEMGRFFLGSTVILLLGAGAAEIDDSRQPDSPVRLGEALGVIRSPRGN